MVAAGFVTLFAYLLLSAPVVRAVGDVTWQGSALQYGGQLYAGPINATGRESFNLPAGTQIYRYVEPQKAGQPTQKAHFIYFGPNVDTSQATSAKYVEYIFTPPDSYTQPSNQRDLTVDASTHGQGATRCAVAGGLGWIICPISDMLAAGMDWIYNMLEGFLVTQPIYTTQDSTLYQAWSIIRNIANVVFVISFIIIIYSQLTSLGIGNYGIKKLLPRLILAAILVNISYYIAAFAVDVSNIIGTAIHDLMLSLRYQAFNNTTGQTIDTSIYNWSSIVGIIMSGGTILGATAVGASIAIFNTGGSIAAMIYLVLPLLLGLFLTVLVILLILAARQAIIVCLVIIAPLAFVAYLLPGTDKWFDRWKDLFLTMLFFFPAFSLIFSGAQLAGSLIIQNASSLNMIILGLAVQVAPLVVTPLLLKLSGRVLGAIAGIVNNPKRGLVDRTKNWAGARAEMHKQRALGEGSTKPHHLMRRYARHHDRRTRYLKERTDNYTGMADNNYLDSDLHSKADMVRRDVSKQKEIIEKQLDIKWNAHVQIDKKALEQDLKLRVLNDEVAVGNARLDKRFDELKAGRAPLHADGHEGPLSSNMVDLLNRAEDTTKQLAVLGMASQAAKNIQQRNMNEALSVELKTDENGNVTNQAAYDTSQQLLKVAAGIDPNGMVRAQANAATALAKIQGEVLENNVKLLQAQAIKHGTTVKNFTAKIVDDATAGRSTADSDVIEAALEVQAQEGNVWAMEEARGSVHIDQPTLTKVLARNSGTMKSKGGFSWQSNPDLNIKVQGGNFDMARGLAHIEDLGNTAAENIKDLKAGWLVKVSERISTDYQYAVQNGKQADLQKVYDNFYSALHNPETRDSIGDRINEVEAIESYLYSQGFRPKPPLER